MARTDFTVVALASETDDGTLECPIVFVEVEFLFENMVNNDFGDFCLFFWPEVASFGRVGVFDPKFKSKNMSTVTKFGNPFLPFSAF